MMPSKPHLRGWVVLSALAAGCHDLPTESHPVAQALIISDTSVAPAAASQFAGVTSVAGSVLGTSDVAYVSMPPGTTTGSHVQVRNLKNGLTADGVILDGGFDPLGVPARAGDTLETRIVGASGQPAAQMLSVVQIRVRPRVVRTIPPRGKRGVPLNARLSVVFSEPIDRSSTQKVLRLMRGATEVPGRVEVRDLQALSIDFVPDANLDPSMTYQLIVSEGLRDRDGDLLEGPFAAEFVTGNTAGSAAAILLPDTLRTLSALGPLMRIRPSVLDAAGNQLRNPPLHWSSSDASIISLSSSASEVTEVSIEGHDSAGAAIVTVQHGQVSSRVTVLVERVAFTSLFPSHVGNGPVCYLSASGRPYCRGDNDFGQLGVHSAIWVTQVPVAIAGNLVFTEIATNQLHACALTVDGTAYCWGYNAWGQAGASTTHVTQPARIGGNQAFQELSVGAEHSCGITQSGKAYCWGKPPERAGLPFQSPGPTDHLPALVPGEQNFVQITAGGGHTCALSDKREVYCWGSNKYGQLGNGSLASSAAPVRVSGSHAFVHVSAADEFTCGVTIDGVAYCWGDPSLATGNPWPASTTPLKVAMPADVVLTSIDVGTDVMCGLDKPGNAYCWGYTYSATAENHWIPPTRVPGGHTFKSIIAGAGRMGSACGNTDDAVYCWQSIVGQPVKVAGQR